MSEALHTVTITGTPDEPAIEFRCHGDRDSECHRFPDACACETWFPNDDDDSKDAEGHPRVVHDHCWMRGHFDHADEGGVDPMPECLAESDIKIGDSGPITAYFNGEFIEWEFVAAETQQKEEN